MIIAGFLFVLGAVGAIIALALAVMFWRVIGLALLAVIGGAALLALAFWGDSVTLEDAWPLIVGIGIWPVGIAALHYACKWQDKRFELAEKRNRDANDGWSK